MIDLHYRRESLRYCALNVMRVVQQFIQSLLLCRDREDGLQGRS